MFIIVASPFITYVLVNVITYNIVSWIVYNVAKYLNSGTQAQYAVGGITFAVGLAVVIVKGIGDVKEDESDRDDDSEKEESEKGDESDKEEMEGGDNDAESDYSDYHEQQQEEDNSAKWMILGVFIMMMGATVFPQINKKLGLDIYAYAILCVSSLVIFKMSNVDKDETSRKQQQQ
jgi:hypothetical protein